MITNGEIPDARANFHDFAGRFMPQDHGEWPWTVAIDH
jgi:hypothetical protein